MPPAPLRLCEYQTCRVDWSPNTRAAIAAAAQSWAQAHALSSPPLSFDGPDGCLLRATQHVGVIEAGGVRVEIYPKLDAALVSEDRIDDGRARSVMANLLWLLEVSGYGGLVDAGDAAVEDCPDSITDLLAWLYARRLRHQLALGRPREYIGYRDDLNLVRGSIQFARQATTHFGRPDIIACAWDELSDDTALARLLRCASEVLLRRVRVPGAAADLREALALLDDAQPVHPLQALAEAASIRWSRLNARWRPCHDLALAVLHGLGRDLHAGSTESFVFLLDMNNLFESYCLRWLEARLGVAVRDQVFLGKLLVRDQRSLYQYADYLWREPAGTCCVGDAKYKIAREDDWPRIDDIRQLICYGQLAAQLHKTQPGSLMLLYPTTSEEVAETVLTFDHQPLTLQAVRVVR